MFIQQFPPTQKHSLYELSMKQDLTPQTTPGDSEL